MFVPFAVLSIIPTLASGKYQTQRTRHVGSNPVGSGPGNRAQPATATPAARSGWLAGARRGVQEVLAVRVAGVDRLAGLTEPALSGWPARDTALEQVDEIDNANPLGSNIASIDEGCRTDHLPSRSRDGLARLPQRVAGINDVIDHQNPPARDQAVIATAEAELTRQSCARVRLAVFGEAGQGPEAVRGPLGDGQPACCRATDDVGLEVPDCGGQKLTETGQVFGVRKDSILVDPAAAVVPGDIDEMVVLQDGVATGQNAKSFLGGSKWSVHQLSDAGRPPRRADPCRVYPAGVESREGIQQTAQAGSFRVAVCLEAAKVLPAASVAVAL